ncbi:MAG: hypothetical protein UT40_C0040G0001, partial [Candidatus Woesebacteria bacterium GW2011_GWA1_39_21b]
MVNSLIRGNKYIIAILDYSYAGILNNFMRFDNHPPLYYLTLKFWTDIFGYSEVSLRFPSIIFGIATIYLAFLIARKISNGKLKGFPEITAIILATSQFHIYYSQEARMYSMAAFFSSAAIYSFINTFKKDSDKWWILFSVSITILLFTDYAPVFLLPVFWLYGYLMKRNKIWRLKFIASHITLLIFGYFWLPTFLYQSGRGRWLLETLPGWRRVAGGATLKQALLVWMKFVFGRLSFPRKIFYYTLVGLASAPFIISFIKLVFTKKPKYMDLIDLWLIAPLALGFVASFWFPAFVYFRFLYVLPAFYLLVSWAISSFTIKTIKNILVTLLVGVNLFGWVIYISDENQQREQWRQAVLFIEKTAQINDIVIFEFTQPFAPYKWYAKNLIEAIGVTDSISAD